MRGIVIVLWCNRRHSMDAAERGFDVCRNALRVHKVLIHILVYVVMQRGRTVVSNSFAVCARAEDLDFLCVCVCAGWPCAHTVSTVLTSSYPTVSSIKCTHTHTRVRTHSGIAPALLPIWVMNRTMQARVRGVSGGVLCVHWDIQKTHIHAHAQARTHVVRIRLL